jgi:hypothetical protein
MNKNLLKTIFTAIALAFGVTVVVMNILGTLVTTSAFTFLGLGLACLAIAVQQGWQPLRSEFLESNAEGMMIITSLIVPQ